MAYRRRGAEWYTVRDGATPRGQRMVPGIQTQEDAQRFENAMGTREIALPKVVTRELVQELVRRFDLDVQVVPEPKRNALVQLPKPRMRGRVLVPGAVLRQETPAERRYYQAVAHVFEGFTIRVLERDGVHWLVVQDLVKPLGYANANRAISGVPATDVQLMYIEQGTGRGSKQRVLCVTWEGLNRLLVKSNKPNAQPFIDWVCRDVLKQVRQTGTYVEQQAQGKAAWELAVERLAEVTTLAVQGVHDRLGKVEADVASVKAEVAEIRARPDLRLLRSTDEPYDRTAKDIGDLVGVSAVKANQAMKDDGLQVMGSKGSPWRLTEAGREWGQEYRTQFGTIRIAWRASVADHLTRPRGGQTGT